jgi:hypothetical protein
MINCFAAKNKYAKLLALSFLPPSRYNSKYYSQAFQFLNAPSKLSFPARPVNAFAQPCTHIIILIILTLVAHSHARDVLSGKVVGVSDDDTITVLEDRNQCRRYCLERFYKFVGDVDIIANNPPTILEFANDRAKTQSSTAANKDRKNINAFYSRVQQMYGVMYDPTAPVKMKRHQKQTRRLIPIQDILKVLLAAQGHDRVLLGAYWRTGARKSDVLQWTWADDSNFEDGCQVSKRSAKGRTKESSTSVAASQAGNYRNLRRGKLHDHRECNEAARIGQCPKIFLTIHSVFHSVVQNKKSR